MSTLYHDSSNWPMLRMFVVSRGMKYTPKEQPPLAILAGERHCAPPFNSRESSLKWTMSYTVMWLVAPVSRTHAVATRSSSTPRCAYTFCSQSSTRPSDLAPPVLTSSTLFSSALRLNAATGLRTPSTVPPRSSAITKVRLLPPLGLHLPALSWALTYIREPNGPIYRTHGLAWPTI
jgi:hypothetical protein